MSLYIQESSMIGESTSVCNDHAPDLVAKQAPRSFFKA
jgi:hypothetical protein